VNNATTGGSSEVTKRVEPEVSSSEGVVTRSRRRQAALVEAEVTIGATVEASSQPLQMREVAERTEVCVSKDLPMDTDKVLLSYTISLSFFQMLLSLPSTFRMLLKAIRKGESLNC